MRVPSFPAGVAIAVLGVVAVLQPLLRPEMGALGKAVWTIGLFGLMSVEILAVLRERRNRDSEAREDRRLAGEQFRLTMNRLTELQRATASVFNSSSRLRDADAAHVPAVSLKRRTLSLADEMQKFLLERKTEEPPSTLSFPLTREMLMQEADNAIRYADETLRLFAERFTKSALRVYEELVNAGLADSSLKYYIDNFNQTEIARRIGERLGALAEQLPDGPLPGRPG